MMRFLGTMNYYRRFIPDYAQHSTSLTETTCKSAPSIVDWTQARLCDFVYLCSALADKCLLHIPLVSDYFVVQTDASGRGIGGVLSVRRDGCPLHSSLDNSPRLRRTIQLLKRNIVIG